MKNNKSNYHHIHVTRNQRADLHLNNDDFPCNQKKKKSSTFQPLKTKSAESSKKFHFSIQKKKKVSEANQRLLHVSADLTPARVNDGKREQWT